MQAEHLQYLHIRRAYEWGRARTALRRALVVFVPVAIGAIVTSGRPALAWLPATLAAWVFAHWRGGPVLRGAFFGLAGGAVTWLLPLSVLRPCCTPESMAAAAAAGRDCCTMPTACLSVGALVGLALAAFVPTTSTRGPRLHASAGVALGVASIAVLRCPTLFAGEAVGLFGGLVAGVVAATAARLALAPRPVGP